MTSLKLLSGGAAQGLVAAVTPRFTSQTGCSIDGEFGAVGTMAAKLRGGAAVDVMILTAALIDELAREGLLVADSAKAIGAVETAVAVREGDPAPPIADTDALRAALLAADAIFVPDIVASTAGIHVAKVLAQLGILDQVRPRLKIFPNGATAMRELAKVECRAPDRLHPGDRDRRHARIAPGRTAAASLRAGDGVFGSGDDARDGCVGGEGVDRYSGWQ